MVSDGARHVLKMMFDHQKILAEVYSFEDIVAAAVAGLYVGVIAGDLIVAEVVAVVIDLAVDVADVADVADGVVVVVAKLKRHTLKLVESDYRSSVRDNQCSQGYSRMLADCFSKSLY